MSGKTEYVQTKRVLTILHAISASNVPLSLQQILDRVSHLEKGTSERTIYRDLEFLQKEMNYILRSHGEQGYRINSSDRLPVTKSSLKKLIADLQAATK